MYTTITFKPLKRHHFPLLLKWLQAPHVRTLGDYNTVWTLELIEDKYHTYVDCYGIENGHCKKIHAYIIESDTTSIGYIQYYNAYDFEHKLPLHGLSRSLATVDFFIGEKDYWGKGIGSHAFCLFLKKYIDFREDTKKLERLFQTMRQKAFVFQPPHTFKIGDYAESVKEDEVWVAEQDNTILGFVAICPAHNLIHNLFVHHAFQGKEIGKRLLCVAEKSLSRPIMLETVLDNFKARQFYESQGYEKLSIHKNRDAEEFYVTYKKEESLS